MDRRYRRLRRGDLLSPKLVAQEAVSRIFQAIEAPKLHESVTRYLPARFVETPPIQTGILPAREELRFAMYDCSSARSLEMLAMIYERESGKRIHFDMYSYRELEELLYTRGEARDDQYDGFMMDITWLEGLVESGCVQNLDHLAGRLGNYLDGFIEGAVRDYGMYVESLYAIPFMSGAQILFYPADAVPAQIQRGADAAGNLEPVSYGGGVLYPGIHAGFPGEIRHFHSDEPQRLCCH